MELERLKSKYRGKVVNNYVQNRSKTPKWVQESAVMQELLAKFASRTVVDVPVGTGRFMALYAANRMPVIGLDASPDMVEAARQEAERHGASLKLVEVADAMNLDSARHAAEVAVCIRFMNWLDAAHARTVLGNIARVASEAVIVGFRAVDMDKLSFLQRRRIIARRKGELQPRKDGKPHNYMHVKSDFDAWLQEFGLVVEECRTVEVTPIGADYCIYVLRHG